MQKYTAAPSADIFHDDLSAINISQLQSLQGWQARYKQFVIWGKLLSEKPTLRTDTYRVRGCDTAAWLGHWEIAGKHQFALDADSKIIRGLGALLLSQINDKNTHTLKQFNIERLLIELDLKHHLSPSRSNGFLALFHRALKLAALGKNTSMPSVSG